LRVTGVRKGECVVGVDLGGTWVRVVLSDRRGIFIKRAKERIDTSSPEAISRQIEKVVRFLCQRLGIEVAVLGGVGIASAGPLIQEEGVLINPTNMPFEQVSLTKPISEELAVAAYLINDCVGAALGEKTFGAAKGLDNYVYVTIGTGIGGGAIVNGTLLWGKDGNAHEIGHLTIDYSGRLTCGCGKRGHWEAYCSGRNIPNFVKMRFEELEENAVRSSIVFKKTGGDLSKMSAADLFDAAKNGDKLSLQLVEEIGVLNAIGFANVINSYDPSLITVGGSVTLKNKKAILSPIKAHVEESAVNRLPEIKVTPLGEDAGLYGAVAAVQKYL
jgi:glucokinase